MHRKGIRMDALDARQDAIVVDLKLARHREDGGRFVDYHDVLVFVQDIGEGH